MAAMTKDELIAEREHLLRLLQQYEAEAAGRHEDRTRDALTEMRERIAQLDQNIAKWRPARLKPLPPRLGEMPSRLKPPPR